VRALLLRIPQVKRKTENRNVDLFYISVYFCCACVMRARAVIADWIHSKRAKTKCENALIQCGGKKDTISKTAAREGR